MKDSRSPHTIGSAPECFPKIGPACRKPSIPDGYGIAFPSRAYSGSEKLLTFR